MSFVSQLDTIFRQLRSRLDLRDLQNEPVYVPSQIIPVLEISDLIGNELIQTEIVTSITATGVYNPVIVPANEKWFVHAYRGYKSTGTWTMTEIAITDGSNNITIKSQAAAADIVSGIFAKDIILNGGWKIGVYVDSYSVTGNMKTQLFYRKEDVA